MRNNSRPEKEERKSKRSPLPSSLSNVKPSQPQAHPATGQSLSPVDLEALPADKKHTAKSKRRRPSITIAPSPEPGPDVRLNQP